MDYTPPSHLDEHLNDSLELNHSACFYCNGFYGPSFGEPVCATCHEFLFTEDLELFQRTIRCPSSWFGEKDDGDSGNDEPSEEAGPSNRLAMDNNIPPSPPMPASPAEEEEIMELAGLPLADGEGDENENDNIDDQIPPDPDPDPGVEQMEVGELPVPVAEVSPEPVYFPELIQNGVGGGRRSQFLRPHERLSNRLALLTLPRPPYERVSSTEDMSLQMPPEIWAIIFRKLDDISLAMVSKVSSKWKAIVLDQNPNGKWEEFVKLRWPLFSPMYTVTDWYSVYCDFIDSVPCKLCFFSLAIHLPFDNFQPVRSLRTVRLHKELKWLRVDHPEGIEAVPLDPLNYNWLARISGPPQSPYQGGVFYLNLKVPHDYPLKPPIVRFLTRILHPNVSRHGDIGIDCIQHNWTLALTIPQILLSIQSLLTDPYLETNMEPTIANLYEKDRATFDKIARIWTWKYAMHDVLLH